MTYEEMAAWYSSRPRPLVPQPLPKEVVECREAWHAFQFMFVEPKSCDPMTDYDFRFKFWRLPIGEIEITEQFCQHRSINFWYEDDHHQPPQSAELAIEIEDEDGNPAPLLTPYREGVAKGWAFERSFDAILRTRLEIGSRGYLGTAGCRLMGVEVIEINKQSRNYNRAF